MLLTTAFAGVEGPVRISGAKTLEAHLVLREHRIPWYSVRWVA
nr:hypothetical protein [Mycobacterium sp.]